MKTRVLDSWPVLEWLQRKSPTDKVVQKILLEADAGRARLHMSAINVGEVYYFLCKHHRMEEADEWRSLSQNLPVTIDVPDLREIWDAAVLKGRYAISYADAFAAALAQRYQCPVMTGDPEFQSVGELELHWLG